METNEPIKKKCSKCGAEKVLEEFYKNKRSTDGHRPDCKICTDKVQNTYKNENKEKIHLSSKKHYQKNKTKILKERKKYRQKNKKKLSEKKKNYYQKNKKECSIRMKLYRESHKKELIKKSAIWRKENAVEIKNKKHNNYQKNKTKILANQKIRYKKGMMGISIPYIAQLFQLPVVTINKYPALIEAKREQIKIIRALQESQY
jgi:hypothetical protein